MKFLSYSCFMRRFNNNLKGLAIKIFCVAFAKKKCGTA